MAARESFEETYGLTRRIPSVIWRAALFLALWSAVAMSWPQSRVLAYELMTNEKGPVELGTFVAFIAASLVAARLADDERRRGATRSSLAHGVFAVATFLAGMEEISWGQSLFDFPTPRWLDALNAQGETNVHNLYGLTNLSSVCVLILATTALVLALRRAPRGGAFEIPGALAPLIAIVVGMGAIETFNDIHDLGDRVSKLIGAVSEVAELLLAVACFLVAWLNRRRIRRERDASLAPQEARGATTASSRPRPESRDRAA